MEILTELKEYAQSNEVPILQEEALAFLLKFIKTKKIESVLEVGTAIGYSALQMSSVPSVKRIVTLERNYGYAQIADANIGRADKEDIIEVVNVDALNYKTDKKFDLLFIDGAKAQYQRIFDRFIDQVDYVIADNLVFHGMVSDPGLTKNRRTRSLVRKLAKFKEYVLEHEDYDCQYEEVGDGLLLISKKQPAAKGEK